MIAPDRYLSATEAQISGSEMLYTGEDKVVEAPYSGESVRVRPIPWQFAELVPLATRPGTTPNNRA